VLGARGAGLRAAAAAKPGAALTRLSPPFSFPFSTPTTGDYWGEQSFFRIPLGVNSLFIEDGDCWYGTVGHVMEDDVRMGRLVGTMYGVVKKRGGGGEGVEGRVGGGRVGAGGSGGGRVDSQ